MPSSSVWSMSIVNSIVAAKISCAHSRAWMLMLIKNDVVQLEQIGTLLIRSRPF